MASVTVSYDDTLRTMRTGKKESTTLATLQRYMTWGRGDGDALPYTKDGSGAAAADGQSSYMSWPAWASTGAQQTPWYDTFGLTMMQRYAAFALCIFGAVLLFFLAFMHMPLVIIRPSKFVVPYCLGNILLFTSFGFLHGFYSYAKHLFSSNRLPFTGAFLGTTFVTLYVSMIMKMYALTIPMAIIQFVAMVAYVISYIPGGTSGLSMFGSLATTSIRSRMAGGF